MISVNCQQHLSASYSTWNEVNCLRTWQRLLVFFVSSWKDIVSLALTKTCEIQVMWTHGNNSFGVGHIQCNERRLCLSLSSSWLWEWNNQLDYDDHVNNHSVKLDLFHQVNHINLLSPRVSLLTLAIVSCLTHFLLYLLASVKLFLFTHNTYDVGVTLAQHQQAEWDASNVKASERLIQIVFTRVNTA